MGRHKESWRVEVLDFDVEGLLHGRVHFGVLWNFLRNWISYWEVGQAFSSIANMVSATALSLQYATSKANAASKKAILTALRACVATCECFGQ